MLQFFRDRLTGAMVWVFVALIAIPFAFWGIESFRGGDADPTVAKVGDVKITQAQFRAAYQQRFLQLQQLMGENFRPDQIDGDRMRQGVLDAMVRETALRQFARESGYRSSDADLLDELRNVPEFQENGAFSPAAYRNWLKQQGQSPERAEAQMRETMTLEQMRDGVQSTGFDVTNAIKLRYQLEHQKRSFQYVRIDADKYAAGVELKDADLKAEYEGHAERYRSPERVKLQYVELAMDKLGDAPAPASDVLKAIYDANRQAMFSTPEERKARHILISFGADKDAARKKAEDLSAKLKGGADFAELARQNSDDAGSKTKGGDLGWVRRGMMVAPFESALFELKANEISAPVESPYGWHIIQLEDVHAAATKAFDDAAVQTQLLDLYKQQWSRKQFQEASEKLDQLAFENPSSLDAVSKALNLKVQTTDWLTRDSREGLAATPALLETAFSPTVVQDGENSKPVQLSPTDWVVVRKAEYEPSRQQPYDDVLPRLRDAVRSAQALVKAQAVADALVAAVGKGDTLEAAAKAQSLAAQTVADAERRKEGIDAAVLAEAFKLARPAAGKLSVGKRDIDAKSVAVVAVSAVADGELPPTATPDAQALASQLRQQTSGAEFAAYQAAVQQQVGVKLVTPPQAGTIE